MASLASRSERHRQHRAGTLPFIQRMYSNNTAEVENVGTRSAATFTAGQEVADRLASCSVASQKLLCTRAASPDGKTKVNISGIFER